jgi:DnaK suppressor protein
MTEGKMTVGFNLLRSRLESERKRLIEELEQLKSSVRPADERREGSPFGKREEEATESFELEKRLTLEKRIREQLAEVEHALHKFEEGTYGLCDICGQPIDPARLEALPQASLCLSCKARQAKNAKGK